MAMTSLVDRDLSMQDQVETLADTSWVPPQQLNAVYQAIVREELPSPARVRLGGDRRMSPLLGGLAAVVDGDEAPSDHPVGRYLFPSLERSGALVLDPGEHAITSWKSYTPSLLVRGEDGSDLRSDTWVPERELKAHRCVLTDQRLVFHGRLSGPMAVREDYPSIFLPEILFESIAAFRQIKRFATRPNLHWCFHIRHEWVAEFGFGNVPTRRKPLLLARDDTMFIFTTFRYPTGEVGTFRLPYKQGEPQLKEIGRAYLHAIRKDQSRARVVGPIERMRQIRTLDIFSFRDEEEATTSWTVEGSLPWSLPPTLGLTGGAESSASSPVRTALPSESRRSAGVPTFAASDPRWRADPIEKYRWRWWDGTQWTPYVVGGSGVELDAAGLQPPVRSNIARGWYEDPFGRADHRYWDGLTWSPRVVQRDRERWDTTGTRHRKRTTESNQSACARCGGPIVSEDQNCDRCGAPFAAATDRSSPIVPSEDPSSTRAFTPPPENEAHAAREVRSEKDSMRDKPASPPNGLIAVTARNVPYELELLGMRCDEREIPDPLESVRCEYWIGAASVAGVCYHLTSKAQGKFVADDASTHGMFAIAIGGNRMYGIVAPQSLRDPAIWFAPRAESVDIEDVGSEGVVKKRPRAILLIGDSWNITLTNVSQMNRQRGHRYPGESRSLLNALLRCVGRLSDE